MVQKATIDTVTRIEGHAKVQVDLDGKGGVSGAHLQVIEIRGFEKLLEKMELFKMPQITARICGVCPPAHHLASIAAIENGLGITAPKEAKLLRELLNAGLYIHSHALSIFLLCGPDILMGVDAKPATRNVFGLLSLDPELAKKVLKLRSIGQRTVEMVGGRGVHPVAVIPGGMAAHPSKEKLALMAQWGQESLGLLDELGGKIRERLAKMEDIAKAATLPNHSLALTKGGALDFFEGEVVVLDEKGAKERSFAPAKYADHLIERVLPGSYMKTVRLKGAAEKSYFVGPLARLNVNDSIPTPKANGLLQDFHAKGRPRLSALEYIEARLIEMVHCAERLAQIAGGELTGDASRVDAAPKEGRYIGLIEAPRGILIHDYTADKSGRIAQANLIVATQNNYDAIDRVITSLAGHFMPKKDDNLLTNGIEFGIRCFDPCLACATHVAGRMPMEVIVRREGEMVRTIVRRAER